MHNSLILQLFIFFPSPSFSLLFLPEKRERAIAQFFNENKKSGKVYDTFRTFVELNPLLFFIQKRIDGFLNSSLNLFTLNGILDLFTQSSRHIKHVDHLI
jgi:hypothetical protein